MLKTSWRTAGSVPHPLDAIGMSYRARRKPRLLFRLPGMFLLRLADRQFCAVLFQLPPRITRLEPYDRHPKRKVKSFSRLATRTKAVKEPILDCASASPRIPVVRCFSIQFHFLRKRRREERINRLPSGKTRYPRKFTPRQIG